MGGRLDATNAVQSSVRVITPIDFDHEKWLGHSIAEIAAKRRESLSQAFRLSRPQQAGSGRVIRARAEEVRAPLQFVTRSYDKTADRTRGDIKSKMPPSPSPHCAPPRDLDDAIARGLAASSGQHVFNSGTNE